MSFVPAIRQLNLTNYRNYSRLALAIEAAPVVLIGANGAGKSNLLEALSFFVPGRGLRQAKLPDISCRSSAPCGWTIAAVLENLQGSITIGTAYEIDKPVRRHIRIDGQTQRDQSTLLSILSMIWLTPQMDTLFLEAFSERRRFFDRLVYSHYPSHADLLTEYQNLLKERLKVLLEYGIAHPWLNGLEQQMSEHAVAIASARLQHLKELQNFFLQDEAFPQATMAIQGTVETSLQHSPALKVEEDLQEIWAQSRKRDQITGMTHIGPQRSDFMVHDLASGTPAEFCSTGEQKMLLLSILLAQANWQKQHQNLSPILLLDEVAAHLDPQKRERFFNHLIKLQSQFWLSGTEMEPFSSLKGKAQFFDVEKGLVKSRNM